MKNCLSKIFRIDETSCWSKSAVDLLLRLTAGLFMASHGWGKVPPSPQFVEGVIGLGFPLPEFFAWCAGLAEFAGGLLLALGLLTRPASFFMAFTMAVAAFGAHGQDPLARKELPLLYLALGLYYLIRGAGPYSVDALISKKCPSSTCSKN